MAQTGFMLSDEGRTISVTNDSGTTAITCGDILWVVAAANDDVLTQTSSTARAAYGDGDIKVKAAVWATTVAVNKVVGVALEDIAASGRGSMAMEGVFIHQAAEGLEAGAPVQISEATNAKLNALDAVTATTSQVVAIVQEKIGRTLTGASGGDEFVIWKLSL